MSETSPVGNDGTKVTKCYGGVYRLESERQGQFKLTAEEIIELYHHVTTEGDRDVE